MRSRSGVAVAVAVALSFMALLFTTQGYDNTWRFWRIHTLPYQFADTLAITTGAASLAQGYDPMVENPANPLKTMVNYPRVWQTLYALGVNETHTTALGVTFAGAFLIGLVVALPGAGALLAFERGNADLLMFLIVSVAIVAVRRFPRLSTGAILSGFFLKLYPIFAVAALLRLERPRLMRHYVIAASVVVAYLFLSYSDLRTMWDSTARGTDISFGVAVLWTRAARFGETPGMIAFAVSIVALLFSVGLAGFALTQRHPEPAPSDGSPFLDAFRAGAAIYVGTFMMGTTWEYRLMFLIFAIPQLVAWARNANRAVSLSALVCLVWAFISLWEMAIEDAISVLPFGSYASFVLVQGANWALFCALLSILCWTMPEWVKQAARRLYPRERRLQVA